MTGVGADDGGEETLKEETTALITVMQRELCSNLET